MPLHRSRAGVVGGQRVIDPPEPSDLPGEIARAADQVLPRVGRVLDPQFPNRLKFPEGMTSGYYKYIVFDEIPNSTGKVYDLPCHKIMKKVYDLPNSDWVAGHHWCVPLYYKGE